MFKTVLKNGYALPHPNCRHEFIAWFEELESPEEVEKAIQKSKIKYDKSGNLVDVRYQKDIKGYQEWQAGNRQLNKEFSEYEKMRTYYESKDMQPPYTTLAGFRRARRKKAEEYKENKKVWNKIADFSKYGEKLPKPKGYPREFLKSAKYEKKFTEIVSLDIAHKLTVFAREVIRENDRLNEETAIAITLSGEKILKQHSPKLTIYIDETEINKQTDDSVILIHNHPQNDTFSSYDLGFMQNKKIHTLIAVCHDGKVFSLRTNCGKTVDNYIISEYNRNTIDKKASEKVFLFMAKKYGWEYKEL